MFSAVVSALHVLALALGLPAVFLRGRDHHYILRHTPFRTAEAGMRASEAAI